MIPTIDDRLASIVRALTEVILPHLPPEASLAQEQAQLCIGHIQILRGQLDAAPAFEREELADAVAIAGALRQAMGGDLVGSPALAGLASAVAAADGSDVRAQTRAINLAVEGLVKAVSAQGSPEDKAALARIILEFEHARAQKDRAWCAPFGFDTL